MTPSDDKTPPAGNPADRRQLPRVTCTFRVSFGSVDELVVSFARDMSQGGIFIRTSKVVPLGSLVRVLFKLPSDAAELSTIARIVHCATLENAPDDVPGVGLEFIDLDGAPITKQISDYLAGVVDKPAEVPAAKAETAHILIVDDQKVYRDAVGSALRAIGHDVVEATNGIEALGLALRQAPDLIITDVEMPEMDGWQLVRMIRARPSFARVPIIFLTSLSSDRERLKGYQLGVDDYLSKPIAEGELRVRVERVLARMRSSSRSVAKGVMLRGDLSLVSIKSLLSFLEMERRTGILLIVNASEAATLYLKDGAVLSVDLPPAHADKKGVERLFHVCDWTEGRFELTTAAVELSDDIGVPVSFALLEHARREDEGRR